MCDGNVDLFLQLVQELARRPGPDADAPRPGAVQADVDEIRMMEDAFDLLPSTQMEDISPDVADEAWNFMEQDREADWDPNAAENSSTNNNANVEPSSAQNVDSAHISIAFHNQAGGTEHGPAQSVFGSIDMSGQGNAQRLTDRSSDIPMLDVPSDPSARRLEYLLSQDHGLIDDLIPVICPSGSSRDAEAMGGHLSTIEEE
ncbi:hypothetical protein PpBr36_02515 [Pyricularia pennisetigena]|uniref:hypothetical protein n=1 Tax=Pyricularia pennisetigena TaxID=1578925 RepID=UPI0011501E81|nr:hypothetical protein PpBr36_02515 [Pyricularia pennisetigena]TLS31499.1 hypothetical protein PpBr36_02515 [Pyricularia pennisetigena]